MADTPFGLSFGQPSKYMSSSGVGPAIKAGLTAYGMQKSGLTDWLNNLNKKPEQQNVVQGAVPLPASFNQYLSSAQPGQSMGAVPPQSNAPAAFSAPNETPPAPQMQMTPPPDIGNKILEGDDSWESSSINPQAERDSLMLPQQAGYNQMLATGNEYQQVPGYGSTEKALKAFLPFLMA
jgi:hypothetical protein